MIFLPDEHKRTIIPRTIRRISFLTHPRIPLSLFELSLRATHGSEPADDAVEECFPREVDVYLERGPICLCGYEKCKQIIFTECYFLLLKK